jgi:hypothetical protein
MFKGHLMLINKPKLFWMDFWRQLFFWREFFGGIFWREFFWRQFLFPAGNLRISVNEICLASSE